MYKTREEVESMIELIETLSANLRSFGLWVVSSLASPTAGVICHDKRFVEDSLEEL
tara:strand:+ start:1976 stop:2143 length:168 start_codon:yes stop_codon:yes gene_type:complete